MSDAENAEWLSLFGSYSVQLRMARLWKKTQFSAQDFFLCQRAHTFCPSGSFNLFLPPFPCAPILLSFPSPLCVRIVLLPLSPLLPSPSCRILLQFTSFRFYLIFFSPFSSLPLLSFSEIFFEFQMCSVSKMVLSQFIQKEIALDYFSTPDWLTMWDEIKTTPFGNRLCNILLHHNRLVATMVFS